MKKFAKVMEKLPKKARVLHLTHTDLDGYGPRVIVSTLWDTLKKRFEVWDFIHVGTKDMDKVIMDTCKDPNTWKEYDVLFITDISCSDTTAGIIKKCRGNVILLDHHVTAMGLNRYPFAYVKVERDNSVRKECGTSLFWKFLETYKFIGTSGIKEMGKEVALEAFVNLVAAWDTWDWQNVLSGWQYPVLLNTLFDAYGRTELFVYAMKENIESHGLLGFPKYLSKTDNQLLAIYNARKDNFINDIKEHPFRIKYIKLTVDGKPVKMALISANDFIAEVFAYMRENIDADVYAIDMSYSLTLRSDTYDVSKLAKICKGGGHVGAAGFAYRESRLDFIKREFAANGIEAEDM